MENVFKGNCRAEDFGGRESRAQGLKRPATSLARFSAITRRQSRSRSCQCGLVVHRTNGRGASACSSTRTVSRSTVAHNTQRPMLLRNYSMSGMPGARTYRVSVKRETNGVVSSYLCDHVHAGDILEVSAPRGGFILRSGDAPVVLLSAGIGATPVLAMLHSLSSAASRREVWWIYGARNRAEHPFAKESRGLLQTLVNSRSHIVYSKPDSGDEPGVDYDSVGHVDTPLLDRLGVTRDADFYLCGPPSFLKQLTQGLKTWGADSTRIHRRCLGRKRRSHQELRDPPARRFTLPRENPASDHRFHLHEAGSRFRGIHGFPVCWNLQKLATFPYSGRAAQGSAIPASAH
jgi:ferredoxin-NADP reductase